MSGIYSLSDPSGVVRYVGQSKNPYTRYMWHVQAARRGHRGRVYNWIRSLLAVSQEPSWSLLQDTTGLSEEEVDLAEVQWITHFHLQGVDLTNCTKGGRGLHGMKHSEETRAKIGKAHKGRVVSAETRVLLSKSRLGVKLTPEHCKAISEGGKGRRSTPEQRAAISRRMRGNKHSLGCRPTEEQKDNQAERFSGGKSPSAHLTDEQASEMRVLYAAGSHTQADLARLFGVTSVTAHRVLQHKTYRGGKRKSKKE